MSADQYGIDPETMGEEPMPEDGQLPPELMEMMGQEGVDPGAGPVDPMLQQEPDEDPYAGVGEFETRERVELCVLLALESCAKAIEAGVGADNAQFAMLYGQASASLGQAYASLTHSEQAELKAQQPGQQSLSFDQ